MPRPWPSGSGVARETRPGATAATAHKWWTWPDLKVGDCHQTGGRLRLYADGKLTFSSGGRTLFTTGTFEPSSTPPPSM
ncbi:MULTISPECIES: hypothetical protein [Streptomyces]|uniref:Uncharacterized protein n=1 Tax=Streptomyces morookaense TaxID=1970 RepID=A0A7Y7E9Z2_STRMO|nr:MULTISPECIES: hypothetical protein [Streptomyces]MCC2280138.1 hypothetical protein [Streptomyces sp. ET3-23]NVK80969.1 hypothetical protein [Streptomyces morookaense]GHF40901.1 hypothetical protein GCM10010359_49400 [Streptomyces morookaense]